MTLREIGPDIEDAVLALRVAPGQERFVATMEQSFFDAVDEPEQNAWMRAVVADGTPVGFVMVSWDIVPVPGELEGPYFLWRLLIDADHQGKGYGTAALDLVIDAVVADGAVELITSCVPGEGNPLPFYERLGFVRTERLDPDGEVIIALDLHDRHRPPAS